jgi:hypothetical protein
LFQQPDKFIGKSRRIAPPVSPGVDMGFGRGNRNFGRSILPQTHVEEWLNHSAPRGGRVAHDQTTSATAQTQRPNTDTSGIRHRAANDPVFYRLTELPSDKLNAAVRNRSQNIRLYVRISGGLIGVFHLYAQEMHPRYVDSEHAARLDVLNANVQNLAIIGQNNAIATVVFRERIRDRWLPVSVCRSDESLTLFHCDAAIERLFRR